MKKSGVTKSILFSSCAGKEHYVSFTQQTVKKPGRQQGQREQKCGIERRKQMQSFHNYSSSNQRDMAFTSNSLSSWLWVAIRK